MHRLLGRNMSTGSFKFTMTVPKVDYVYKIVPFSTYVPITSSGRLPEDYVLPASDLDKGSGFMHMSTAAQVSNTLKRFFRAPTPTEVSVYVLKVPYRPLDEKGLVKWEDPDGNVNVEGLFPHIYDNHEFKLSHEEVESVAELVSESGEEGWEAGLAKATKNGWLV